MMDPSIITSGSSQRAGIVRCFDVGQPLRPSAFRDRSRGLRKWLSSIGLRARDIDIYATVASAFAVAVLSFFDILSPQKVSSLSLVVLAILAINSIATREFFDKQVTGEAITVGQDFPKELRQRREDSGNMLLIGNTLGRTVNSSYASFEKILANGGAIRILVTDPDADAAAMDSRTLASRPEIEESRAEVRRTLRMLQKLQTHTTLEVRTTKSSLHFGVNYLDIGEPTETIYVQHYSYRLPGESRPHLTLTRKDAHWFECYRQQAEQLWTDGDRVER